MDEDDLVDIELERSYIRRYGTECPECNGDGTIKIEGCCKSPKSDGFMCLNCYTILIDRCEYCDGIGKIL